MGAQYVLAQDPDTDRFTAAEKLYILIAVPGRDLYSLICVQIRRVMEAIFWRSNWSTVRGLDSGMLQKAREGTRYVEPIDPTFASNINLSTGELAIVASTVSSKMVEAMAKVEGFKFVESLTGKP